MFFVEEYQNEFVEIFNHLSKMEVIQNSKSVNYSKEDVNFDKIKTALLQSFDTARLMPAFGVSLHNETLKALKSGKWIKLTFDTQMTLMQLPFDELLINLDDVSGSNLIRKYNGKYDGRCIYIDFDSFEPVIDILHG